MASNLVENVYGPFGKPMTTITNRDYYFKYNDALPDRIEWSDYISVPRNCTGTPEATKTSHFFTGMPIQLPRIYGHQNPDDPELIPIVLVPGSVAHEFWSHDEICSFNLGMYLFDKDFADIKRFVETKSTDDILWYYYMVFNGSDQYNQWSERMKLKKEEEEEEEEEKKMMMMKKMKTKIMMMMKSKKKKNTEKKKKTYVEWNMVFSGKRQRELKSRLNIPRLDKIIESIPEGETFVLDCALRLKGKVGIKKLVKAIAIDEGEKDLTRTDFRRSRSNHQVTTARQKMPTGNELADIGTSEILNFLQGGCRLNKARSDDLFWEAVWPRLLGRGWNSEQPVDKRCSGPNNQLVFLVPGVEKFSRTEHVKGVDYFDSITDVLRKVIEKPGLMYLKEDGEAERGASEDRNDQQRGQKQKQAGPVGGEAPIRKRRRRLITAGNHDELRGGGIGCPMTPRPDIGPSCQGPAWVKSPPAGLSNGSPVADARSMEPPPDNPRGARLLFDLNKLPQASEDSEHDNEPIMPENSNRARNDKLGVVDMNPLRHGTRIRPRTPKGKSYGDSTTNNRKPKK